MGGQEWNLAGALSVVLVQYLVPFASHQFADGQVLEHCRTPSSSRKSVRTDVPFRQPGWQVHRIHQGVHHILPSVHADLGGRVVGHTGQHGASGVDRGRASLDVESRMDPSLSKFGSGGSRYGGYRELPRDPTGKTSIWRDSPICVLGLESLE